LKPNQNSLSRRLLFSIGTILFVTQGTTIFWLLHEEQEIIVRNLHRASKLNVPVESLGWFNWEIVGALFFPALLAFLLSLFVSGIAIKRIISPLYKLTTQLQQRHVEQWQPFDDDGSSREVTAITHALNLLMQKLQLAFSRERQFTSDVSHELRTPIAGIRLNLELLEQQSPQEIMPLIARLDSMQRTIDQLLTMARLEQKMVMGLQTPVDLVNDVILPAQNEFRELLQARGLAVQLFLPDSAYIVGDKTLLSLLLRNLVENSSRYADSNTTLTISLTEQPDGLHLSVRDTGNGVDETHIAALTDAFQRFDQRGSGVGLGLNIVARICALHHAKLQIKNHNEPHGLIVDIVFSAANKKG
jgi:two-component system sensor histidine kinase BasS